MGGEKIIGEVKIIAMGDQCKVAGYAGFVKVGRIGNQTTPLKTKNGYPNNTVTSLDVSQAVQQGLKALSLTKTFTKQAVEENLKIGIEDSGSSSHDDEELEEPIANIAESDQPDSETSNLPSSFPKQVTLDPNATEFTPSPTPCQSPSPPTNYSSIFIEPPLGHFLGQEIELPPMLFPEPTAPVISFCPPGPAPYSMPPPPLAWEMQAMSMRIQTDVPLPPLPCHNLPPTLFPLQSPRTQHLMQPCGPLPQQQVSSFVHRACAIGVPPPPFSGKEHPSRSILLSEVSPEVSTVNLKQDLEKFGPVRALGMERLIDGFVTVHYFDIRNSRDALHDIQQQHLLYQQRFQQNQMRPEMLCTSDEFQSEIISKGLVGGKAVWAQYLNCSFSLPGEDGVNQGTLVVFNLDSSMPLDTIKTIFEAHGAVKELRETPSKRQHKFVEFFDVRDACRAKTALDGNEIGGKRIKIEYSRPGGLARRARLHNQGQVSSICHFSPPVQGQPIYWSTAMSLSPIQAASPSYMWSNFGWAGPPAAPLASCSPIIQQGWNYSLMHQQAWPGKPSGSPLSLPCPGQPVMDAKVLDHNVKSNGREGDFRGRHYGDVLTNGRHRNFRAFANGMQNGSQRTEPGRRNCIAYVPAGARPLSGHARPKDLGRTAKMHSRYPRDNVQSQYAFDEYAARNNHQSGRTTLMIRNIPNKYSQQMLLELLDQHCLYCNQQCEDSTEPLSAYDFVYLPIDFKNRCNLGYAFVNFTTVQATLKLYAAFNNHHWEAFNSRKICQVSYARVQGRAALEEHFRNSKFTCDTDDYLPLVFSPPRNGVECPAPTVAAGHATRGTKSERCKRQDENQKSCCDNQQIETEGCESDETV